MILSKLNLTAAKKMLLMGVMCFMASSHLAARGSSRQVTFSSRNISVREVLAQIQEQTDFVFAVNLGKTDVGRNLSLSSATMTVDEALRATGCKYVINGRYVVFTPTAEPASAAAPPVQSVRTPAPTMNNTAPYVNISGIDVDMKPRVVYDTVVTTIPHNGEFGYAGRDFTPSYTGLHTRIYRPAGLPDISIKTNLLYGVAAQAPNLSMEIGTGGRTSIEFMGGWNGWHRKGTMESNKKLAHIIVKPEFRWWSCERFNGHFFGLNTFYWKYNVAEHKVPLLFAKEYRYDGHAFGAGLSYGYHWALDGNWGLEFNIGAGVAMMEYDRYSCVRCSREYKRMKKTYFGPTNAGIKVVFVIK